MDQNQQDGRNQSAEQLFSMGEKSGKKLDGAQEQVVHRSSNDEELFLQNIFVDKAVNSEEPGSDSGAEGEASSHDRSAGHTDAAAIQDVTGGHDAAPFNARPEAANETLSDAPDNGGGNGNADLETLRNHSLNLGQSNEPAGEAGVAPTGLKEQTNTIVDTAGAIGSERSTFTSSTEQTIARAYGSDASEGNDGSTNEGNGSTDPSGTGGSDNTAGNGNTGSDGNDGGGNGSNGDGPGEPSGETQNTVPDFSEVIQNDPPQVGAVDLGTTAEDTTITFSSDSLLANSHDADGHTLKVKAVTVDAAHGIVNDNGDGSWTFIPSADFHGENIPLGFEVSDGRISVPGEATIDISAVNDSPIVANVDLGYTNEDHQLTFNSEMLLSQASDIDGDKLQVVGVTVAEEHGIVRDNGDGSWTFTPAENFNGQDIPLSFDISDGIETVTAHTSLDVNAVNDAPVVGDVDLGSTDENTAMTFSSDALLAHATDIDSENLEVTTVTVDSAHGSVTENPDGSWTFNPAEDFYGEDIPVTFTVSDGETTTEAVARLDVIEFVPEDLVLVGTKESDTLVGGEGNDVITGKAGDDILVGAGGNDIFNVRGNAGVDQVDGGEGLDVIQGSRHNDTIRVESNFDNIQNIEEIKGGAGYDTLQAGTDDDVLDLSQGPVLKSIEEIDGGKGDDTIIGTSGDDKIEGNAGNDTLFGGKGNDTFKVRGNAGLDQIDGGEGHDTIKGTRHNDTIKVESGLENIQNIEAIQGGAGYDTLQGGSGDDVLDLSQGPTLESIEEIDGGKGNDTIIGTAGDDKIEGNAGDDTLLGGQGNDTFMVRGNAGLDQIDGGDGYDTIKGTRHNDTIKVESGLENIQNIEAIQGGAGYDTLQAGIGDDVLDLSQGPALEGIEEIDGGKGDDTIIGTAGDDKIEGNAGNDILFGGQGNDTFKVRGNAGMDQFDGGEGHDTIQGTRHNDTIRVQDNLDNIQSIETIDGGAGHDTLLGGQGDDVMDFSSGPELISIEAIKGGIGHDTITGGDGNDTISGNSGRDTLAGGGGGGNDHLDGGHGKDTLSLQGNRDEYVISRDDNEQLTITDMVENRDGTDTAINFEFIQFADQTTTVNEAANQAPVVAAVDLGETSEDTATTFSSADLLANTTDPDGDTLEITSVSVSPEFGSVADQGDGTWEFIPAENFNGADVPLSFEVSDGLKTSSGQATIDVTAINDMPVVGNVSLGNVDEDSQTTFNSDALLANTTDVDGDDLTITNVSVDSEYGAIDASGEGSWTFTPAEDFHGDAVPINFEISDGSETVAATASIDVIPVNDAPIIGDIDLGSTDEDAAVTFSSSALLSQANDLDGDQLEVVSVSVDESYGHVSNSGDGNWIFTPAADVVVEDVPISFEVSDGNVITQGEATLDVVAVNDAPVVGNIDLGATDEDVATSFSSSELLASASDIDGDDLEVVSVSVDAAFGEVADNGDGNWTFTPAEDFRGDAVPISFEVSDGAETVAATASIDVIPVNDAPVVGDVDLGSTDEDVAITFSSSTLLSQASDLDGDELEVVSVSVDESYGHVSNSGDGNWTLTPAADVAVEDVPISFEVSDGNTTTQGQATLDVVAVNDAPIVGNVDLDAIEEDTSSTFTQGDLLAYTSDIDGDNVEVINVSVDANHGSIQDNSDGSWTFTPKDDFNADGVAINFTASDGQQQVDGQAVIDVTAVNDLPEVGNIDLGSTDLETALTFSSQTLLGSATDADGDSLEVTDVSVDSSYGNINVNGDGSWTFHPAEDVHGENIPIEFTVSDGTETITAQASVDVIREHVEGKVIVGSIFSDSLHGTDGDDHIYGGWGNDTLIGNGGDDTVYGDLGRDTILGGDGNDTIDGGWSNDYLEGNDGNDSLSGSLGDDRMLGGAGNDNLDGGWGNDNLDGDEGNDTIDGDLGNDTIRGGVGDDTIDGGWGRDNLQGNEGDDTITGDLGNDTIAGGQGDDTLDGGWDTDTLVLQGLRAEYSIAQETDSQFTVTDSVEDRDGTDSVSGFEFVMFSDQTVSFEDAVAESPAVHGTDWESLSAASGDDDSHGWAESVSNDDSGFDDDDDCEWGQHSDSGDDDADEAEYAMDQPPDTAGIVAMTDEANCWTDDMDSAMT